MVRETIKEKLCVFESVNFVTCKITFIVCCITALIVKMFDSLHNKMRGIFCNSTAECPLKGRDNRLSDLATDRQEV